MPLEQPLGRRSGVFLSDGIGVIENGLPPLPDVITHESMVLIPIGYWVAPEIAVVVFFYFGEIPGLGVRPFVMTIPYYQEAGKWTFEEQSEIRGFGFPFDPVTQPERVVDLDGSHFVFSSLGRRQAKGRAPMWVATGHASREVRYITLVQEGSEDRRRLDSHFGTWVVCTQVREPFEVVAFDSSGQELSRLRYPHGTVGIHRDFR